jgi:hypothetical protein
MTRHPVHPDTVRAYLAHACEDARHWPAPEIDAQRVEAAVLEHVAKSAMDSLVVPRSPRRTTTWALAAAAGVVGMLGVLVGLHGIPTRQLPPANGPTPVADNSVVNADALVVGSSLQATTNALFVQHAGQAKWRLAAPGRAHIVALGERVVVALDEGRIDAEVVPKSVPETFAIDAEDVHVAVHGTVFSVERRRSVAEVTVKEGTVRVTARRQQRGPDEHASAGSTDEDRLLVAPAHWTLEMHPVVTADTSERVAQPAKPVVSNARPHVTAEPIAAPRPELDGQQLSPEELEQVWDRAAQLTEECFASQPSGDPHVRVSVGTQITVRIAPDGGVAIASFNPPLPSAVSNCAMQRAAQLHATPTAEGSVVSRAKTLLR